MFYTPSLPDKLVKHRARIAFWEFNEGLRDGYPSLFDKSNPVIAMFDFNKTYFQSEFGSGTKVVKILYPLRINVSGVLEKKAGRLKFGLQPDEFVVFNNFAYSSGWHRKNPAGAIRAFAKAFRAVPNSRMVFKTVNSHKFPFLEQRLLELAEREGVSDKLLFFNDWMDQVDLYSLTNCCDVYLSLHRTEGFGLGIAEAMILSKAVVATDYSATTEFCRAEHAIPVLCRIVPVSSEEKDLSVYRGVKYWAEPDLNAAASALSRLYHEPESRILLGRKAKDFITKAFSVDRFKESVFAFLRS